MGSDPSVRWGPIPHPAGSDALLRWGLTQPVRLSSDRYSVRYSPRVLGFVCDLSEVADHGEVVVPVPQNHVVGGFGARGDDVVDGAATMWAVNRVSQPSKQFDRSIHRRVPDRQPAEVLPHSRPVLVELGSRGWTRQDLEGDGDAGGNLVAGDPINEKLRQIGSGVFAGADPDGRVG